MQLTPLPDVKGWGHHTIHSGHREWCGPVNTPEPLGLEVGLLGKGIHKIASTPMAQKAPRNPLGSPGEDDGGHIGVAKLAECRLGAAGSHFPPRGVILAENDVSTADPRGLEIPISADTWTQSC